MAVRQHRAARMLRTLEAGIVPAADQLRSARTLRAEWQAFLAEADFRFGEDALSHDTVSLEDAGLEEDAAAVFGLSPDVVGAGVYGAAMEFYDASADDVADYL